MAGQFPKFNVASRPNTPAEARQMMEAEAEAGAQAAGHAAAAAAVEAKVHPPFDVNATVVETGEANSPVETTEAASTEITDAAPASAGRSLFKNLKPPTNGTGATA
jgi:hypothetical protein